MFWRLFKSKKGDKEPANIHVMQVQEDEFIDIPPLHDISPLQEPDKPEDNSELNEKEIFLLHYLHHRKIEWGIDQPVRALFDDCEQAISRLKQKGYLADDDHSAFLEEMTVANLKAILKEYSLPVSGKKNELVKRIRENTTPEQRAGICPDLYYILSLAGKEIDEDYKRGQKEKKETLKGKILEKIQSGNYEQAVLVMAEAYSKELIPPGIGVDWSDTEKVIESSKKERSLLRKCDFSDLQNTKKYKELLFRTLYYDNLIEHNLFESIKKIIIPCGIIIACSDLDEFFKKKGYEPNELEKVYTYLSTKQFNIFQTSMQSTSSIPDYKFMGTGMFNLSDSTIAFWKKKREDTKEFNELSGLNIEGFPKTLHTFQLHKEGNDEKYREWIKYKK